LGEHNSDSICATSLDAVGARLACVCCHCEEEDVNWHDEDIELLIRECEEELRTLNVGGMANQAPPEAFTRLADLIEARVRQLSGEAAPEEI
jgi:hypothetical protein